MALIDCRECNKQISDEAESCPHCGCPLVQRVAPKGRAGAPGRMPTWLKWVLGIAAGLWLLGQVPTQRFSQYAPPKDAGTSPTPGEAPATCVVSKWNWRQSGSSILIEGVVSNPAGFHRIDIQADDANGNLLGTDFTYLDSIGGFKTYLSNTTNPTKSLNLKYGCQR